MNFEDYTPNGEWRPANWRARVAAFGIICGMLAGAVAFILGRASVVHGCF